MSEKHASRKKMRITKAKKQLVENKTIIKCGSFFSKKSMQLAVTKDQATSVTEKR